MALKTIGGDNDYPPEKMKAWKIQAKAAYSKQRAANLKATEAEIKRQIRIFFGQRSDLKLFNNPVGQGYSSPHSRHMAPDLTVLKDASRIDFGLCKGSSDLIGWVTKNGVAVFLALEVKTATGRPSPEQLNFIEVVRAAGGIAGIVRGVDDVKKLLGEQ